MVDVAFLEMIDWFSSLELVAAIRGGPRYSRLNASMFMSGEIRAAL